ncbi:MAG: SdiA-regulated domain-containing protein [Bacteroidota bacterium]|nr:SdiA-regulated domain-containing protein [Bacteroidota bacterium]
MNFISYTSALLIALLTFGTFKTPKPKKKKGNILEIVNTWELPDALEEVSGIAWVSDAKIAAVEDEDGLIYIYDLAKNKIDKTIEFADDGDYEGIAVTGEDAYVMRSDGLLFEVQNYATAQPVTKTYQSAMSHKNNVETLSYDAKNQRLLTAPKDLDPNDEDIKGIYAFDLKQHLMLPDLVARIDMKDKAFKKFEKNKAYRTFRPSDLAIHPKTGEIYMLEGVNPKLIILDKTYAIKKVYELDKDDFAQPEGITFNPDGTLFISNEAHGGTANIHQVELD